MTAKGVLTAGRLRQLADSTGVKWSVLCWCRPGICVQRVPAWAGCFSSPTRDRSTGGWSGSFHTESTRSSDGLSIRNWEVSGNSARRKTTPLPTGGRWRRFDSPFVLACEGSKAASWLFLRCPLLQESHHFIRTVMVAFLQLSGVLNRQLVALGIQNHNRNGPVCKAAQTSLHISNSIPTRRAEIHPFGGECRRPLVIWSRSKAM